MTVDLEEQLHTALHARGAAITADRLRPPVVARRETGPRGARLAPFLAAAAVAAIVLAVLVVRGADDSRPAAPGSRGSDLTDVVGRTWALTTVRAPDGTTTAVSGSISASVTFLATGRRIEFQDGISAFRAAYAIGENGHLRVHGVSGDKIDYAGRDRSQLAAIAGVDAIGVPYGRNAPGPILVQLAAGRLHITAQGYRLTFDDPVPVATSIAVPPPTAPSDMSTTPAGTGAPHS